MFLTLDNLANRYNCLPSEALGRATTLDLMVLDLGAKWHNYQSEVTQNGGKKPAPKLSTDEMLKMIHETRKSA